MDFPDHLDEEDMRLAIKEWKLSGLHIERLWSSAPDPRQAVVVYPRDPVKHYEDANPLVAFTQRGDGLWVNVTADDWATTIAEADAYEVP